MRAAATRDAENGRKYMAAQTFRQRRLTRRWRPMATTSARTTVVGTDISSKWMVFRTAVQKVESVRTFSYSRIPTNWLVPPGTVRWNEPITDWMSGTMNTREKYVTAGRMNRNPARRWRSMYVLGNATRTQCLIGSEASGRSGNQAVGE